MKKIIKFSLLGFSITLSSCIIVIALAKWQIHSISDAYIYDSVADIPHCDTALVLGCSPKLSNGNNNTFYTNRINKAVELYQAGKVKNFIVSGDNSRANYDEPTNMKNSLIKKGIPAKNIYCDYAGFRTLDSVVRAKEIFSQNNIIVVSQEFHNRRAIFIAQNKEIQMYGINAKEVVSALSFKTTQRENLARVKTLLDIWVLNKQPKFKGEKVTIK